jgi:hypothetical protein
LSVDQSVDAGLGKALVVDVECDQRSLGILREAELDRSIATEKSNFISSGSPTSRSRVTAR